LAAKLRPKRSNTVRIIGGRWRGRLLSFPDSAGLRPTPDRTRETLFNWLGQRLDGLRCIDLFAGSGALGFEAASRGAAEVVMVERDARVAASLRECAHVLGAESVVRVTQMDALAYIESAGEFDVIFIDPPFDSGLLPRVLALAATRLTPEGRIYAESGNPIEVASATGLGVIRQARAGLSHSYLLERA
jgi:16S rRNA (guanine(966)-N(2))-methyltransferase RsmD